MPLAPFAGDRASMLCGVCMNGNLKVNGKEGEAAAAV
jgi:hypothetical protein